MALPGPGPNQAGDCNQARLLDPRALVAHRAVLYRAARALCRSHHEAEDLVQETFTRVLARPRELRRGDDLPYLLRALRNTHIIGRRFAARRPKTVPMPSVDLLAALDVPATVDARRVIAAIAAVPAYTGRRSSPSICSVSPTSRPRAGSGREKRRSTLACFAAERTSLDS